MKNTKTTVAVAITTALNLLLIQGCSTEPKVNQTAEENTPSAEVKTDQTKNQNPLISEDLAAKIAVTSLKVDARQQMLQKMEFQSMPAQPSMQHVRPLPIYEPQDRENYAHYEDNGISLTTESPVSTFSIDVDTGAYTNVRRILNQGQLPRIDAVRAEEFINYFNYDYEAPKDKNTPFLVNSDMMKTPWSEDSYLLQVGIKAWEPVHETRPDANLVFLVDVSGSMNAENKLGLLKKSLILLTKQLSSEDRISLVVYAGSSGVVLEPTPGDQTAKISQALKQLRAGGSTNGASGIRLAYQMAEKAFIKGGVNRILLATDGDFNVGTTNFDALTDLVEQKRQTGIALSTLGFGGGNYNDHLMEQLADQGNGQYSYIDSLFEAKKVLVDEMNSSLITVAADVKIQMEFNPNQVSEYRLIGYENRALQREDFNNDKVDAGEIGAGHTVTAIYEIRFSDSKSKSVDPLRYTKMTQPSEKEKTVSSLDKEIGFLKLRYKNPGEQHSQLISQPLLKSQLLNSAEQPSESIQFASAVAGFAQQLRGGKYLNDFSFKDIIKIAQASKGRDHSGIRAEFIQIVSMAEFLSHQSHNTLQQQGE